MRWHSRSRSLTPRATPNGRPEYPWTSSALGSSGSPALPQCGGEEVQRQDVYEAITDRVIAAIEQGAGKWQMPWHRSGVSRPVNAHTKKPYRGVNVVALWAAADAYGYTPFSGARTSNGVSSRRRSAKGSVGASLSFGRSSSVKSRTRNGRAGTQEDPLRSRLMGVQRRPGRWMDAALSTRAEPRSGPQSS